jgi:D-arabinose 1-dehydrogenase-like Zn-dependent alcohol dehydrogenase
MLASLQRANLTIFFGEEIMRGVVFTGDRQLELMTFPDPTPGPDEVVIQMKASGMCGSDLHQYRRPKAGGETGGLAAPTAPTIAGHEPCGIVAAVGTAVSPSLAQVGQRVMVHHYEGCRVCGHCRSGWSQLCQEVPVKVYGNNAHGGHAAYMKVPAFTVVPLPDELSVTTGAAISIIAAPLQKKIPDTPARRIWIDKGAINTGA